MKLVGSTESTLPDRLRRTDTVWLWNEVARLREALGRLDKAVDAMLRAYEEQMSRDAYNGLVDLSNIIDDALAAKRENAK
jgi:hypothetical protein